MLMGAPLAYQCGPFKSFWQGKLASVWAVLETPSVSQHLTMVNGQWSTLYAPLGSLFQAQGKSETILYAHYHLQKCKNSARLEDHKS